MIKTIDPLTDRRWDAFIKNHPESTIFHLSAWTRVLLENYKCSLSYFIMENDRGEISAVSPFLWINNPLMGKKFACLPGSEFCYPLAYREEDLQELMSRVKQEVDENKNSYLEIRGWGKLGDPVQHGLKSHPYFLQHIVDLDVNIQKVRARIDRNGRYNLRHAEKSQLLLRVGQDERDLKEFYRLNSATRRRHNLLPQPYHFFQSIRRHMIIPGHAYLMLAMLHDQVIAANLYFRFKETVLHEFSAQDEEFREYRPNYLLIWKAMENACVESYKYYSFGRTQPENQPLANFKRHWGSRETVLPYYYYPSVRGAGSISQKSMIYRIYILINKFLPDALLNLAGNKLFKYMG